MANVDKYLAELAEAHCQLSKKKAGNPFVRDYVLGMEKHTFLEQELVSWYQYLIGILMWMVEIGRVYIITKVSVISSHMAVPREGHLEVVSHVFLFLCQKYNYRMAFDPTYPAINKSNSKECK